MGIPESRLTASIYEALTTINRVAGSGGGSGLTNLLRSTNAAGGNQGGYSTANSTTWADITNSTFTLLVPRPSFFLYFIYTCANISLGAGTGYVRGNIVNFDVSANLLFNAATFDNGTMMYFPTSQGPIQTGQYTVKMQAATDSAATTVTINQFFHVIFLIGG